MRLLDEIGEHFFGHLEIRDHAIFHRLDGHDVARRAAQHVFRFLAHGDDFAVFLLIATMEGSFTTMPFPLAYTNVLAVPKSIAKSEDNRLKTDRKLYPFLLIIPSVHACDPQCRRGA